jgi:uncharacterized protein (DUF1800 family)
MPDTLETTATHEASLAAPNHLSHDPSQTPSQGSGARSETSGERWDPTGWRGRAGVPGVSRRGLLAALGGGALAALGGRRVHAGVPDAPGDVDPASLLNKLVRRVTFGYTPAEGALAQSLGYQGYLEHHLNHLAIEEDPNLLVKLASLTTLSMTYSQIRGVGVPSTRTQLQEAAVLRAVSSTRQLYERMVEFWTDHFSIDAYNGDDQYYKTIDDREVIRAHALGSFPQMLAASAHSPAMLYYLNNDISTAVKPNENYAREIMELHTLGVDGGYTQQDVQEVARCFTGWTIYPSSSGAALWGTFRYNPATHDNGAKSVLGFNIPAGGGQADGDLVLQILATHPNTAKYIAKKLCAYLLGYNVPQATVDAVASTYSSTGGDIKSMIRTALAPDRLAAALPKLKRPFHHFVSTLRGMPSTVTSTTSIRTRLSGAGHLPFAWPTPDGYPDAPEYWQDNVLARWNFGASMLNNEIGGVSVDATAFFTGATTADASADRINLNMTGNQLASTDRNELRDYMLPNNPTPQKQRDSLGLAAGSPSFQWF